MDFGNHEINDTRNMVYPRYNAGRFTGGLAMSRSRYIDLSDSEGGSLKSDADEDGNTTSIRQNASTNEPEVGPQAKEENEFLNEIAALEKYKQHVDKNNKDSLYHCRYFTDPLYLDIFSLLDHDQTLEQKSDVKFLIKEAFTGYFGRRGAERKEEALRILQDSRNFDDVIRSFNDAPENDTTLKLRIRSKHGIPVAKIKEELRYRAFEVIDECRARHEPVCGYWLDHRPGADNMNTATAYLYLANGRIIGDIMHLPGFKMEVNIIRASYIIAQDAVILENGIKYDSIYPDAERKLQDIIAKEVFHDSHDSKKVFTLEKFEMSNEHYVSRWVFPHGEKGSGDSEDESGSETDDSVSDLSELSPVDSYEFFTWGL